MAEQEFVRWDPKKQYKSIAQPSKYLTASGHEVILCEVHVEYFLLGIMEGHPDAWRAHVLNRVREQAWLVVKEPAERVIPRYVIRAVISDYRSWRTVCWFDNELASLEKQIVANIGSVDWVKETGGGAKLD
jgi:hypothetical protein